MGKGGKKWLFWSSIIICSFSIGGFIYTNNIPDSILIYNFQPTLALVLVLSILNIAVLISIPHLKRKWFILTSKIAIFILPVFVIVSYILSENRIINSILAGIIFTILIILLTIFTLFYLFLIREESDKRGIWVLITLVIVCIVLQQFSIYPFLFEDFLFPVLIILTAAGMYVFGLRCLFILGKNVYLKVVTYIACTLIAFGGFAFLSKFLGGATFIDFLYFIPAFLLTLTVLFSLPVSGYINWELRHKRILQKIMISWMFFFIIFSVRFVFPDFFRIITPELHRPSYYFQMNDYDLQNKNGLEPE